MLGAPKKGKPIQSKEVNTLYIHFFQFVFCWYSKLMLFRAVPNVWHVTHFFSFFFIQKMPHFLQIVWINNADELNDCDKGRLFNKFSFHCYKQVYRFFLWNEAFYLSSTWFHYLKMSNFCHHFFWSSSSPRSDCPTSLIWEK